MVRSLGTIGPISHHVLWPASRCEQAPLSGLRAAYTRKLVTFEVDIARDGARRQVEDGRNLLRVMVDVEVGIKDKPVGHRVDSCSYRRRHHPRVEVSPELPFGLEAREFLLEKVDRNVCVPTVDSPATIGHHGSVSCDVNDGDHGIAMLSHEREIRLDVDPKPFGSGRLGKDARGYVGPSGLDDLNYDLPDEVAFAGEVVADHALADTDPLCDASKGSLRETDLGDGVDGGGDDLLAPRALNERPLLGFRRHRGHEQNL